MARDFWLGLISDNNIGQWLPFPPYPLPNVVLQVQKNIERKVDIIVATLKEGKRGRAFFCGWPETFGWDCSLNFTSLFAGTEVQFASLNGVSV